MYSPIKLGWLYLKYWLSAANSKGHGIHSPFVFDLVQKVFNDNRFFYAYESIEQRRAMLINSEKIIVVKDFGAGSRVQDTSERKVSTIAKSALKPLKYGQLMFRLVNYFSPTTTLELGTSLGITTSYLAAGNTNSKVVTMEGAPAVATIARESFDYVGLRNVELVEGNFDETLKPTLEKINKVNFAFIDGNHRYAPTMNYFKQLLPHTDEHTVIVFDDIHWSKEMEQAWEEIKSSKEVQLTIDLFFIGLVFFRKETKQKEHFTIRF